MRYLWLLVLPALLYVSCAQDATAADIPKISAILYHDREDRAEYVKGSKLQEIFGGSVILHVRNSAAEQLTVKYEVYINSHCALDGNEKVLSTVQSYNVPSGGANISLSQLRPTDDLPCGLACLFVNITKDGMLPKIVRAPNLLTRCNVDGIDLRLDSAIERNRRYQINFGEHLLDGQLTSLSDLRLINGGPNAMPTMSKDVQQSVLVFIRTEKLTQQDVVGKLLNRCYNDDDMDYNGGANYNGTMNRYSESGGNRSEGVNLKSMFEDWDKTREGRQLFADDIPECLNTGFMMYGRDHILVNGDVIVNSSLAKDGSAHIDLGEVKLRSASTDICRNADPGNPMVNGELIVVADPLRIYNDSNLCNNAIVLNITYDCSGHMSSDFDDNSCSVLSDPTSRGHKAMVFHRGRPVLSYDGSSLHYAMSDDYGMCQNVEYYIKLIEMNRWQLLKDRYQNAARNNPQVCKNVDDEEKSWERKVLGIKDELNVDGEQGSGGLFGVTKERLLANLTKILDDLNALDVSKYDKIYCQFSKLKIQYGSVEADYPVDDELHSKFNQALNAVQAISTERPYISCSNYTGGLLENRHSGDPGLDDDFAKASRLKREREEDADMASHGGVEDRIGYLNRTLREAEMKCPGERGQLGNNEGKLVDLIEKIEDSADDFAGFEEVSDDGCGERMLQKSTAKGLGIFLNNDIKKFKRPHTEADLEITKIRFLKKGLEVIEEYIDNNDVTTDDLKKEVEKRMNETDRQEKERCGEYDKSDLYKSDETYAVYWRVKDGKVSMGIPDVFDANFGKEDGARKLQWNHVASCSCRNCHTMSHWPSMGTFYSGFFDQGNHGSSLGGSGGFSSFGSWYPYGGSGGSYYPSGSGGSYYPSGSGGSYYPSGSGGSYYPSGSGGSYYPNGPSGK